MSGIVLDDSKINSYVLPNLAKAKNTIQDAYGTCNTLRNSLPGSYPSRSMVSSVLNKISASGRKVDDAREKVTLKMEYVKRIESKAEAKNASLASAASKIGTTVGMVTGAVMGATGGVAGTAVGAAVGATIGRKVTPALANTGAKIVDGVTSACKGLWDGAKALGTAIFDRCKKVAKSVSSFVKDAASGLSKFAKAVWEGLKWTGIQIGRTLATVTNFAVSLLEGVVSFVEAIGDLVLLVVGGVCSIFTCISDVIVGCITGEWNWTATKAVWTKWIMPWVGYDWTTKAFDGVYSWAPFEFLNKSAYKPFQRGETMYKIGKGVGYVVGIVIASIFTAGAAGAAAGGTSAVASGATSFASVAASPAMLNISTAAAGLAKVGQSAQNGYNTLSDEEKKSMGSIGKVLLSSGIKGAVEAGTWYVTYGSSLTGKGASKLANSSSKIVKTLRLDKLGSAVGSSHKFAFTQGKIVSKFLPNLGKSTLTKSGIQATKEFVNAGADAIVSGEYDLEQAATNAVISAGTSIVYDNTFGSWFKAGHKYASEAQASVPSPGASNPALPTNQAVTSAFKDRLTNILIKIDPVLNYAGEGANGKKVIGTGIKGLYKEFGKSLVKLLE